MSSRRPTTVRSRTSPVRRPGLTRYWAPLLLILGSVLLTATPAQALPLTIEVRIDKVEECCLGSIDSLTDADFYARVFIEGQKTDFGVYKVDEKVVEPGWTATGVVDSSATYASVVIQVFDEDGLLNFEDNKIDITTGSQGDTRDLDLSLNLHVPGKDCDVSGDEYGSCNQQMVSFGNQGSDVARVYYTIRVSEPLQAPGLHVGCMHSPLWPQPGQPVTITATGFGDQPDGQALPAKLADTLEVWYSTDGGITKTVTASTGRQLTLDATRTAGANGSLLAYGCRLVDAGVPIFSGWRSAQVGTPPAGQAVPVLISGPRERALDLILFPVTQNVRRAPLNPADTALLTFPVYTGTNDPAFQAQAAVSVAELMREQIVLDNQRAVNVWLARDGVGTAGVRDLLLDSDGDNAADDAATDTTGDGLPDGDGNVDTCQHAPPANMASAYGFGNVRSFLHPATPPPGDTNTLRECARGGVFSAEATETGVFIHETGHAGWGLSDEYAPDGGYSQAAIAPNAYRSLQACQDDVENLNGVDSDCRGFDSNDTDLMNDVWVSDPPTTDLMNDNSFARRADRRRMTYVFGLAALGKL